VNPGPNLTNCFWTGVLGLPPASNTLIPDSNELVFHSWFVLPPGGSVKMRGVFPHVRAMTWSVYHGLTPYDVVRDDQIAPDAGSQNPFVPGANRDSSSRSYTLTVSSLPAPPPGWPRAKNTIYAGRLVVSLFYRFTVPDRGRDRLGDAGVPDPAYKPIPFGPTLTGQAACNALLSVADGIPNLIAMNALPFASPVYLALLALDPSSDTHPALPDGRWYAFFNAPRLAEPFLDGTPSAPAINLLPSAKAGPAADWNSDSSIAYDYVDRRLGPSPDGHNVLVLHGRMPTTPRTFGGGSTMQGGTQMRYWSLCQNDAPTLGNVGDCLYDEQVPVDANGYYTIVVSLPHDRPANATNACGVGWLNWGTIGDGYFRPTAGLLMIRNQMPAPTFHQAVEDVPTPGTEKQVMGDYLPTSSYQTPAQFAARGC